MAPKDPIKGFYDDFALDSVYPSKGESSTVKEANDLRQADALEGLVESTKIQTEATFDLNREVGKLHEAVAPLNKSILDLIKAIEKGGTGGTSTGATDLLTGATLGGGVKGAGKVLGKMSILSKMMALAGAVFEAFETVEDASHVIDGVKKIKEGKSGGDDELKGGLKEMLLDGASSVLLASSVIPGVGEITAPLGATLAATSASRKYNRDQGLDVDAVPDSVAAGHDTLIDNLDDEIQRKREEWEIEEAERKKLEKNPVNIEWGMPPTIAEQEAAAKATVNPSPTEINLDPLVEGDDENLAATKEQTSLLQQILDAFNEGSAEGGIWGGIKESAGTIWGGLKGLLGVDAPDSPAGKGIGAYAEKEESNGRSDTIGYDSTGGTSYGKYQLSATQGSAKEYLQGLVKEGTEAQKSFAEDMLKLQLNTGSKSGAAAEKWKQAAQSGILGDTEQAYIKKKKYDPAMAMLKNDNARKMVESSEALQKVMFSTAVQHGEGGASGIFNKVYKDGMTKEELAEAVYQERKTRFPSSTPQIQASVRNRFNRESLVAQRELAAERGGEQQTMLAENKDAQPVDVLPLARAGASAQATASPALSGSTVEVSSNATEFRSPDAIREQAGTTPASASQASEVVNAGGNMQADAGGTSNAGPIPNGDYDKLTAFVRGDIS
jgi:hypothetical protein